MQQQEETSLKSLLKQQNTTLHNKIKLLQQKLGTLTEQSKHCIGANTNINNNINQLQKNLTNDSTQTQQDKNNTSQIQYSPIHTCESLQSEGISIDLQQQKHLERSPLQQMDSWDRGLFDSVGQQGDIIKQKYLAQMQIVKGSQLQQQQQQNVVRFQQQFVIPQQEQQQHQFSQQRQHQLSDISQCRHTVSQISKQQSQRQQQQQLPLHTVIPSSVPTLATLLTPITTKQLKKSIQLPLSYISTLYNNNNNFTTNNNNNKQSRVSEQKHRNFYNSAMKQRPHCEQCVGRMHQLHQMEFLKNKYHREYIALRQEVDKIKHNTSNVQNISNTNNDTNNNNNNTNNNNNNNNNNRLLLQPQTTYTPRSSLNFIQFYNQPTSAYNSYNPNQNNEQRSQKSSFSFENIQNTLLSQRFALELQQCIKLVDRLLLVERKSIQLTQGDCRLLYDFQQKVQRLKCHLGLGTQPKFVQELFIQLDKVQNKIQNIHDKYRKLIQRLTKAHKQRTKRNRQQFKQVSSMMILQLKDLTNMRTKNMQLTNEVQLLRSQVLGQVRLKQSMMLNGDGSNNVLGLVVTNSNVNVNVKQKQLINSNHPNNLSALISEPIHPLPPLHQQLLDNRSSISSSCCQSRIQKQLQKLQLKIKQLQKQSKISSSIIKQLKSQILTQRKKSLSDFDQFINAVIISSNKHNNKQTVLQVNQTQAQTVSTGVDTAQLLQHQLSSLQQQQHHQQQQQPLIIRRVSSIIYQIFSFTSLQPTPTTNNNQSPRQQQQQNAIFQPQTQQQLLQMLQHIKQFTSKFDLYQKQKQREISQFKRHFLELLKFFIQYYKIPQEQLLEQIKKSKYYNQPLVAYIKGYYARSITNKLCMNNNNQRYSNHNKNNPNNNNNNTNNNEKQYDRDSSVYTFGHRAQSSKDSQIQS